MSEESKKVKPTLLSGFMELLPEEQILFNRILDTIKKVYELFGFVPLETPLVEKADILLVKGGGETDKQIYRFKKGVNDLALRFDLTIPLARYVAQHYVNLQFPFRRYQIGKVYRGERPQKGRYREFYQCDIDIVGDGRLSLINDAEIPSIIYEIFSQLGFGLFTIKINNRKILIGFLLSQGIVRKQIEVLRVIDKLEKIGKEGTKKELSKLKVSSEVTEKIFDFMNTKGTNQEIIKKLKRMNIDDKLFIDGVNELDIVTEAIDRFGVPSKNISLDLTIARGLDYYTGTVYETILNDYPDIGSICSGGRFDNLAAFYTNKNLPGVGISIGLTRLFSQLIEDKIIKPNRSTLAQVMVIPLDEQVDRAIEVSAELRKNGIATIIYLEQTKINKIFRYADRIGVPFSMIIGGREATENFVSLKNMKTKKQEALDIKKAIKIIRNS